MNFFFSHLCHFNASCLSVEQDISVFASLIYFLCKFVIRMARMDTKSPKANWMWLLSVTIMGVLYAWPKPAVHTGVRPIYVKGDSFVGKQSSKQPLCRGRNRLFSQCWSPSCGLPGSFLLCEMWSITEGPLPGGSHPLSQPICPHTASADLSGPSLLPPRGQTPPFPTVSFFFNIHAFFFVLPLSSAL